MDRDPLKRHAYAPEQREREVLSASQLQPNDEGKSKGGAGVAAAVVAAFKALDVPA